MKEYNACGVMFRRAGKVYDFLTNDLDIKEGDNVVVESDKGEDMARVCNAPRIISVPDEQVMKPILRLANDEDLKKREQNDKDEPEALQICKKMVVEAGIDMKLLFAEYTLDRSKVTFYFTSEGRIDFRQLVRDLARVFKTRIEMRQVGVRDATKMIGGFGICGRELCCTNFLRRFDNISIKMAKNQNLIMNPNKISGVCGRLMCCLMFEKEQYGEEGCTGCGTGCGSCFGEGDDEEYIELNDNTMSNLFNYSLEDSYTSTVEKPTIEIFNKPKDKQDDKSFKKSKFKFDKKQEPFNEDNYELSEPNLDNMNDDGSDDERSHKKNNKNRRRHKRNKSNNNTQSVDE